jgi:sugar phosphate isomerase/epimerase
MPTGPSIVVTVVASALSPDPRVAAQLAREGGFRGLQFDAFSSSLDVTTLSQSGRREFLHVLSHEDQSLVGLRLDVGKNGLGPGADVDRIVSQMSKVMEAAVGLKAPLVCVELGVLPEPPRTERPKPKVTQDMAGLLVLPPSVETAPVESAPPSPKEVALVASVDAAVLELASRADRHGVMLALRSDLSSCAALERVLDVARCPWFGVDLDPVAILRDHWDADEVFSRLGHHVRHVRVRDAAVGSDNRTKPMPVGRGDTRWDQLFSDLDAAGYHGFATVDPVELSDRPVAAAAALKFLQMHDIR